MTKSVCYRQKKKEVSYTYESILGVIPYNKLSFYSV